MSKHILPLLMGIIALGILSACKTTKDVVVTPPPVKNEKVLLSFSKENVSKAEFERVYAKNNGGPEAASAHTTEQFQEYLDLYVNFKRKVFEAEAMGLDTTPAFIQEFGTYKKQLAQPYLSAKEVENQLIQEAYERSGYLVNASHLLINATPEASPEDSLRAYNQALAYRDSIVNGGKSFGEIAQKYSQDPSAKSNKGDLGFFSAFDMVYPFETAAFTTEVGQVSMPVRSQFGYHLVKVNDRIKNEGTKRSAHIIIRIGDRYSAKNEEQAKEKIDEIYQKLKDGADFGALAAQQSDDPGSASKNGDLGTGRLLPEMEAYKLKLSEGEFSEPFSTRFGWHIMKVTEVQKQATFEEAMPGLKQRISRDSRSQISKSALINRIKKENEYALVGDNFNQFKASLDEKFPRGSWTPDTAQAELYAKPLFQLAGGYTQSIQDFIDYYKQTRSRAPNLSPQSAADRFLNSFVEKQLLQYEEDLLPEKNPEFRYLLKEYRDGILLFTLMEQKVWKKAVEDTTGLKAFYESNKDDFKADVILDVKEYRSTEKSTIEQVEKLLKEGKTETQIDSAINRESSLNLRITSQSYEKGKADLADELFDQSVGFQSDIIQQTEFFKVLVIEEKYPAGIKPFEKAKSESITRYQDHLESEWLKELEQKYPVKINETVFGELYK